MSIPDVADCKREVLKIAKDGNMHSVEECCSLLAGKFGLSDAERVQKNRAGARVFNNRVAWAVVNLGKEGRVQHLSIQGTFRLTDFSDPL